MNKRIQTVNHKGKQIIYIDYRGFSTTNEKEYIDTIEEATQARRLKEQELYGEFSCR